MFEQTITYWAAFGAGLLAFFSPCILPLVPGYFTFLAGTSLDKLTEDDGRKSARNRLMASTLAFVLGFSAVFILLGASASFLGGFIIKYQDLLRIVGGIIVIIFGLHVSGLFRIKTLDVEKRMHLAEKPAHFAGTFIIGMAFAAGWSPCIGPILGAILIVAGNQDTVTQGMLLLAVFSAGLAIPFLVLSFFIHLLLGFMKRAMPYMRYINITAGALLIAVGIALLTNFFGI